MKTPNYFLRVLIALDVFANVVSGGQFDETISSRVQKASDTHHGWSGILLRPGLLVAKLLLGILDRIQPYHGVYAIQDDTARAAALVAQNTKS